MSGSCLFQRRIQRAINLSGAQTPQPPFVEQMRPPVLVSVNHRPAITLNNDGQPCCNTLTRESMVVAGE